MPAYILNTNTGSGGRTSVGGADSAVVVAHTVADAKAVAKSKYTGVPASAWDNATVTKLEHPNDAQGFSMVVSVVRGNKTVAEASVTGAPGDLLSDIGVKMAAALNQCEKIHGAAMDRDGGVLTVASAAGNDNLGDAKLFVAVYPPECESGQDASIPGCVEAVVDTGQPEDSLKALLADDNYDLPGLCRTFTS